MNVSQNYELKKVFGKRLKKTRAEYEITQETMADCLGISPSSYNKLERGVNLMSTKVLVRYIMIFCQNKNEFFYKLNLPPLDYDEINYKLSHKRKNKMK
ncbi:MAG: helix-turn-helix transcriptional regulator [Clostridia bacterium]|nr:helix-turn-helix transcriptional regulator [Clostridia bacterium]